MGKLIFIIILLVQSIAALAQSTVSFGSEQSIRSTVLDEARQYFVYLPPSYADSNKTYPVVYVLDGDVHRWKAIAGILEGLSTETLESQVSEAIVVAVPNSAKAIRERDLTPTNVDWVFNGKLLEKFDNIGNAANYRRFFAQELIPEINRHYRTTSQRVLVGESFGGLFAANTLLTAPTTFTDYLIIDATYLWDDNYLNRTFKTVKFNEQPLTARLYFSFANNSAFKEIGETNFNWGQEFVSNLKSNKSAQLAIKDQYFADESHGTVAMLSWYNGLKFLLHNNEAQND